MPTILALASVAAGCDRGNREDTGFDCETELVGSYPEMADSLDDLG